MRRKLTTLRAKQGHTQNGADRTLIDICTYREHRNNVNVHANDNTKSPHWDPKYSGWSNATRPRDYAIFPRAVVPKSA